MTDLITHVRTDSNVNNADAKFICGIPWPLPSGHKYWFEGESMADFATCLKCRPSGPRRLGTPLSQISTQPGTAGYEEWLRISRSWGVD